MPIFFILACSGPGVGRVMLEATVVGWVCFLISLLVTGAAVLSRWPLGSSLAKTGAVVGLLVLLGHPATWLSAYIGDCGTSRMALSAITTLIHGGLVAFAVLPRVRR